MREEIEGMQSLEFRITVDAGRDSMLSTDCGYGETRYRKANDADDEAAYPCEEVTEFNPE